MITIEQLNDFGVNTKEGLARCFGNEGLYLRLVNMLPDEKNFEKLRAAIEANDLDAAFKAAHALKGVSGNLSVTPLYEKTSAVTDLLRSRTETDYAPALAEILAIRDELAAMRG